jgi:hypothetical protein
MFSKHFFSKRAGLHHSWHFTRMRVLKKWGYPRNKRKYQSIRLQDKCANLATGCHGHKEAPLEDPNRSKRKSSQHSLSFRPQDEHFGNSLHDSRKARHKYKTTNPRMVSHGSPCKIQVEPMQFAIHLLTPHQIFSISKAVSAPVHANYGPYPKFVWF